MLPDLQSRASKYRLKAEICFSIACSTADAAARAEWLDTALRWFRLAENAENEFAPSKLGGLARRSTTGSRPPEKSQRPPLWRWMERNNTPQSEGARGRGLVPTHSSQDRPPNPPPHPPPPPPA